MLSNSFRSEYRRECWLCFLFVESCSAALTAQAQLLLQLEKWESPQIEEIRVPWFTMNFLWWTERSAKKEQMSTFVRPAANFTSSTTIIYIINFVIYSGMVLNRDNTGRKTKWPPIGLWDNSRSNKTPVWALKSSHLATQGIAGESLTSACLKAALHRGGWGSL